MVRGGTTVRSDKRLRSKQIERAADVGRRTLILLANLVPLAFYSDLKTGPQGQVRADWLCLKNIALGVRIQESGNRRKDAPSAQP
jgi:hypothetical protein